MNISIVPPTERSLLIFVVLQCSILGEIHIEVEEQLNECFLMIKHCSSGVKNELSWDISPRVVIELFWGEMGIDSLCMSFSPMVPLGVFMASCSSFIMIALDIHDKFCWSIEHVLHVTVNIYSWRLVDQKFERGGTKLTYDVNESNDSNANIRSCLKIIRSLSTY